MEKIKGKNVFVAGATGSIGSHVVRLLSATGAHVFIAGRDSDKLTLLAKECHIQAEMVFCFDITDNVSILKVAEQIHEQILAIDILINATGIGIIKPFEQISAVDFQTSLNVNLIGAFNLLQAFLPAMKERKSGLIINVPGVLGKTPMAGATAYAASKYGLNGMMKSLREELKRTEIKITQLFLGGVDSHFWDTIDLRVQREKMILAEEAGKAIWFLCQQPTSGVVSEMVIQPFNHQAI